MRGVLDTGAAAEVIVRDYKQYKPFKDANIDGHRLLGMTGRQCQNSMINGVLKMKDRELVGSEEEAANAKVLESSKRLWGKLNNETY